MRAIWQTAYRFLSSCICTCLAVHRKFVRTAFCVYVSPRRVRPHPFQAPRSDLQHARPPSRSSPPHAPPRRLVTPFSASSGAATARVFAGEEHLDVSQLTPRRSPGTDVCTALLCNIHSFRVFLVSSGELRGKAPAIYATMLFGTLWIPLRTSRCGACALISE